MRRITLLTVMSITWVLGTVGVAHASCLAPPPIEQGIEDAQVVFVGTVVDYGADERQAVVEVESVWKGEGIATLVSVDGGFIPNGATSIDRNFLAGERYIFFPSTEEAPFLDDSCTLTQQMTPDIDALAPETATAPIDGETVEWPPLGDFGNVDLPAPPPDDVPIEVVDVPGREDIEPEVVVFPDEGPDTVEPGDDRALGEAGGANDSYVLPLIIIAGVVGVGIATSFVLGRMRSRTID